MLKLTDFLRHAAECRAMARTASPDHRRQLEAMTAAWEQLAKDRKRQLEKEGMSDEES